MRRVRTVSTGHVSGDQTLWCYAYSYI